jgi:hypothetical protein
VPSVARVRGCSTWFALRRRGIMRRAAVAHQQRVRPPRAPLPRATMDRPCVGTWRGYLSIHSAPSWHIDRFEFEQLSVGTAVAYRRRQAYTSFLGTTLAPPSSLWRTFGGSDEQAKHPNVGQPGSSQRAPGSHGWLRGRGRGELGCDSSSSRRGRKRRWADWRRCGRQRRNRRQRRKPGPRVVPRCHQRQRREPGPDQPAGA